MKNLSQHGFLKILKTGKKFYALYKDLSLKQVNLTLLFKHFLRFPPEGCPLEYYQGHVKVT